MHRWESTQPHSSPGVQEPTRLESPLPAKNTCHQTSHSPSRFNNPCPNKHKSTIHPRLLRNHFPKPINHHIQALLFTSPQCSMSHLFLAPLPCLNPNQNLTAGTRRPG